MAISDFVLKARVNFALIRDPRVASLDVGVTANDGAVTLTGDLDTEDECRAAAEVASGVEGVRSVHNQLTCGIGQRADTAELVTKRLLEKLDDEWQALADASALAQADYLRWALWLVYKFRIPPALLTGTTASAESEAVEQAISQVAGYVGAPKALIALQMLDLAEQIQLSPSQDAPTPETGSLVSTPVVDEESAAAA